MKDEVITLKENVSFDIQYTSNRSSTSTRLSDQPTKQIYGSSQQASVDSDTSSSKSTFLPNQNQRSTYNKSANEMKVEANLSANNRQGFNVSNRKYKKESVGRRSFQNFQELHIVKLFRSKDNTCENFHNGSYESDNGKLSESSIDLSIYPIKNTVCDQFGQKNMTNSDCTSKASLVSSEDNDEKVINIESDISDDELARLFILKLLNSSESIYDRNMNLEKRIKNEEPLSLQNRLSNNSTKITFLPSKPMNQERQTNDNNIIETMNQHFTNSAENKFPESKTNYNELKELTSPNYFYNSNSSQGKLVDVEYQISPCKLELENQQSINASRKTFRDLFNQKSKTRHDKLSEVTNEHLRNSTDSIRDKPTCSKSKTINEKFPDLSNKQSSGLLRFTHDKSCDSKCEIYYDKFTGAMTKHPTILSQNNYDRDINLESQTHHGQAFKSNTKLSKNLSESSGNEPTITKSKLIHDELITPIDQPTTSSTNCHNVSHYLKSKPTNDKLSLTIIKQPLNSLQTVLNKPVTLISDTNYIETTKPSYQRATTSKLNSHHKPIKSKTLATQNERLGVRSHQLLDLSNNVFNQTHALKSKASHDKFPKLTEERSNDSQNDKRIVCNRKELLKIPNKQALSALESNHCKSSKLESKTTNDQLSGSTINQSLNSTKIKKNEPINLKNIKSHHEITQTTNQRARHFTTSYEKAVYLENRSRDYQLLKFTIDEAMSSLESIHQKPITLETTISRNKRQHIISQPSSNLFKNFLDEPNKIKSITNHDRLQKFRDIHADNNVLKSPHDEPIISESKTNHGKFLEATNKQSMKLLSESDHYQSNKLKRKAISDEPFSLKSKKPRNIFEIVITKPLNLNSNDDIVELSDLEEQNAIKLGTSIYNKSRYPENKSKHNQFLDQTNEQPTNRSESSSPQYIRLETPTSNSELLDGRFLNLSKNFFDEPKRLEITTDHRSRLKLTDEESNG